MRDEFSKATKDIIARRVGFTCSNPNCSKLTVGPHSIDEKAINLGVAAHISAASKGGPRYDGSLSQNERKSIKNGIWLCQSCAKLIDSDTTNFTIKKLTSWKKEAESKTHCYVVDGVSKNSTENELFSNRIKVHERFYNEIFNANSVIIDLINNLEVTPFEKREIAFYLSILVASFSDDNSFYIQNEISLQCIGTFVGTSDIFKEDNSLDKELLEDYRKNYRASLKLLKSVDSKGLIDTSKKTPLMEYYTSIVKEQEKDDFI
jgi:hypothetical protein